MMIELEIQGLSQSREGLLIEVGRLAVTSGFTLQRQRLVQDHHGILLTMVVRGPPRKKRALEAALDACERFISVSVSPFVEDDPKPHFAASRKRTVPVLPGPAQPTPAPIMKPAPPWAGDQASADQPAVASALADVHEVQPETEPEFEFILPNRPAPSPTPIVPVDAAPFVDMVSLGPDQAAVEKMLQELESDYPQIVPKLLVLQNSVAKAASESSLALAGQRIGGWVFEHEYSLDRGLDLHDAIERIGAPALRALVEVDQQGTQLHIHDSPLCTEGHSGCSFFSGFLEGLLGPAIVPGSLSIFAVCCRSYGADECVLAISD